MTTLPLNKIITTVLPTEIANQVEILFGSPGIVWQDEEKRTVEKADFLSLLALGTLDYYGAYDGGLWGRIAALNTPTLIENICEAFNTLGRTCQAIDPDVSHTQLTTLLPILNLPVKNSLECHLIRQIITHALEAVPRPLRSPSGLPATVVVTWQHTASTIKSIQTQANAIMQQVAPKDTETRLKAVEVINFHLDMYFHRLQYMWKPETVKAIFMELLGYVENFCFYYMSKQEFKNSFILQRNGKIEVVKKYDIKQISGNLDKLSEVEQAQLALLHIRIKEATAELTALEAQTTVIRNTLADLKQQLAKLEGKTNGSNKR